MLEQVHMTSSNIVNQDSGPQNLLKKSLMRENNERERCSKESGYNADMNDTLLNDS